MAEYKCGLCGREFRKEEALTACVSCPFHKGCKLIKCPNCGYEFPREPGWLKKLLGRGEKNAKRKS